MKKKWQQQSCLKVLQRLFGTRQERLNRTCSNDAVHPCTSQAAVILSLCTDYLAIRWQRYARGLHLTVTCQLFLLIRCTTAVEC